MSLHELHQLLKSVIHRLSVGREIADNLAICCSAYAEQDSTLLLCSLYVVCGDVLLEAFCVGRPLLAPVFKGTKTTVRCHRRSMSFVAKCVVTAKGPTCYTNKFI